MVGDLNSGSESNQMIFEAYMSVRDQLRQKEVTRMHAAGIGLEGEALEEHLERSREQQIKHLTEEYEEKMLFARMKGEEADESYLRIRFGMLNRLLHVFQGKRWARAFKNEEMNDRLKAEELRIRKIISKMRLEVPK